jgi:thymidylate kinase
MDLAITISNLEKLKNEEHDFVLIDCYILSTIAYFIWKNLCNDKYLNVLYKLFVNVSNPVCSELSYLVNHSPLLKKFYTYQLANKMIEEFMEVIKFLVERNAMFKVDHLFYYDVNYKTIKERIEKKKKTEKLDIFEEMLLDETQYDLLKYIHDVIIKDYSQYLCFHFHNIVNNEKSEEYLSDIILDSEFEVIELKNSSCEELNLLCLDFV